VGPGLDDAQFVPKVGRPRLSCSLGNDRTTGHSIARSPPMPDLSTREAVEKLTQAVQGMSPDDLLDFHNSLFPRERKSELSPSDAGASDRRKILEYLGQGLEIEEILDLWNVA